MVPEGAVLLHTKQIFPTIANAPAKRMSSKLVQVRSAFANLSKALGGSGKSWPGLVKVHVYCSDIEGIAAVRDFLSGHFNKTPIAVSFVVTRLPEHADIALDAVAVTKGPAQKAKVVPDCAILPAGPVAYISGHGVTGDVTAAVKGTLEQLNQTLGFLGLSKSDVVQCKAFIKKMDEAAYVRAECARFFSVDPMPPLAFVEGENGDFPVVIEMIVAAGNSNKATEAIEYLTPPGMTKSPVYSKVVRVNRGAFIYTSGLYANSSADAHGETVESFEKLKSLLQKSGSDIRHVVKATYYVSDPEHLGKLNSYRSQVFDPNRPPATTKALVRDVGIAKRGVSADCIAVIEPTAKPSTDK